MFKLLALPLPQRARLLHLLRGLRVYRLLSHEMMVRLGVAGSRDTVADLCTFALRWNLVERMDSKIFPGERRVPYLYWLTTKGARELNRHDKLHGPSAAIGSNLTFGTLNEVMHRIGIVELHLTARAWCHGAGVGLHQFISDFEPGSKGRQKKTMFNGDGWHLAPDALAWVHLPGEAAHRLLIIELERGGEVGDLWQFFDQKLPNIRSVAAKERVENALCLPDLARFLIVFGSHATYRDGTTKPLHEIALRDWPDKESPLWDRFYVKSEDEAAADFGRGWHQPGGGPPRDLFPELPPVPGATNSA